MILVGLTGNIASGKSTVLQMFKDLGAVTISSDILIHLLQKPETEQTKALAELLGNDILNDEGGINRAALSDKIIKDPKIIRVLEAVYYPTLKAMMKKLIQTAEEANQKIVVVEVPLLFETDFKNFFDTNIVCAAGDKSIERSLERPGMTKQKLEVLNKNRLKENDLIKIANHIINTDVELEKTKMQVTLAYADLLTMAGSAWPNQWIGIEDFNNKN